MRRYEPVGTCIYCGAVEDLRDEHIIQFTHEDFDLIIKKVADQKTHAAISAN